MSSATECQRARREVVMRYIGPSMCLPRMGLEDGPQRTGVL